MTAVHERVATAVTSSRVHQQLLAFAAATAFGAWVGANYVASEVARTTTRPPFAGEPAWVGAAETFVWGTIAVMAVASIGWIVVDHLQGENTG